MKNINNFRHFAINGTQHHQIIGGDNWKTIKHEVLKYRGQELSSVNTETEYIYNVFTGTMEASDYLLVGLEFEDGTACTFHVTENCYDSYMNRISRIIS